MGGAAGWVVIWDREGSCTPEYRGGQENFSPVATAGLALVRPAMPTVSSIILT